MTTNQTALLPTPETLAPLIEGLLFVADRPISIGELATTLEVDHKQIEQGLEALQLHYQDRHLRVQRRGSKVQLVTAPAISGYIERFLGLGVSGRLSTAALETLGIIAYKQPLIRSEIEAIRGVNCDGVLRTLLSKGLIEEVGRLDTPGTPIQYGTTFEFLQFFGLTSLDDLPALEMPPETVEAAEAA